jgi:hypothetical protein
LALSAQFGSFNFTNALICMVGSIARRSISAAPIACDILSRAIFRIVGRNRFIAPVAAHHSLDVAGVRARITIATEKSRPAVGRWRNKAIAPCALLRGLLEVAQVRWPLVLLGRHQQALRTLLTEDEWFALIGEPR